MASEDSLRASSSTGENITPITSSASEHSGAAPAAGSTHRVYAVRQTASSVPVQQGISISVSWESGAHGIRRGGDPSPKRKLEEFKPTVDRDENGFPIYFDPSLNPNGTQWRRLSDGKFAKRPLQHVPGGRYWNMPLPPGYSAS